MKTTSYEVSKRLKEIGFKAETKFCWQVDYENDDTTLGCWFEIPQDQMPYFEYILAYDLETILEALPDSIECKRTKEEYRLTISPKSRGFVGYYRMGKYLDHVFGVDIRKPLETEPLADTAARLLIKLVEEKIINFKN